MIPNSRAPETFLPARGYAIVSLTVLDENGFTHHYAPIETRREVVSRAIALLSEKSDRRTDPSGRPTRRT